MKLAGDVLRFEKRGSSWLCINKGAGYEVGVVAYYVLWKSWVFTPHPMNSYSADMLDDVKRFMEQLK